MKSAAYYVTHFLFQCSLCSLIIMQKLIAISSIVYFKVVTCQLVSPFTLIWRLASVNFRIWCQIHNYSAAQLKSSSILHSFSLNKTNTKYKRCQCLLFHRIDALWQNLNSAAVILYRNSDFKRKIWAAAHFRSDRTAVIGVFFALRTPLETNSRFGKINDEPHGRINVACCRCPPAATPLTKFKDSVSLFL